MTRVLITAFEPYDHWTDNASWLALVELTRQLPSHPQVITRRYPVDYDQVRHRLSEDLAADFDYAIHLGQNPGAARIHLEAIAINVAGGGPQHEPHRELVEDGPVAYRCSLPLDDWAAGLRQAGIPARLSHHAGTYLCNAVLYLSHWIAQQQGLRTQSAFLHVPLDISQTISHGHELASLPATLSAAAVRWILEQLES